MKLSVEAKVAAAVAAAFVALTPGAMAQGRSKGQNGGPNHYGPTNNPGVNTHMSQQGTNAQENRPTFSDERVTASGREQREDRHDAREQRETRRDAREQRADRQQAVRQREQRFQSKSTKDKRPTVSTPFEGSLLDVKSAAVKQ
jgi:hypothetical protein